MKQVDNIFWPNLFRNFVRTSFWNAVVSAIYYFFLICPIYAQENLSPSKALPTTTQVSALSSVELWLAASIMIFGFIVLVMQFILLRRSPESSPDDILRLFTVTVIVIGTMSLIAIGYSSQQIAPALGLFGTILGYLLGKTDEQSRDRRSRAKAGAITGSPEPRQTE